MKNQKTQVLEYIKSHGSISSYEAYSKLKITQLGARIDELKKDGYLFEKKWVFRKNRKSYVRYMLLEEETNAN